MLGQFKLLGHSGGSVDTWCRWGGRLTFDPLSANFFHPDQPELREVEVVYWFSLASHPVIMDANMKFVLPSFTMAGASTRDPPSSFHP